MGLEINAFRHFSDAEAAAIFAWAKAGFDSSNRVIRVTGAGDVSVEDEWLVDRDAFWAAINWRLDRMSSYSANKRVTRTSFRYV